MGSQTFLIAFTNCLEYVNGAGDGVMGPWEKHAIGNSCQFSEVNKWNISIVGLLNHYTLPSCLLINYAMFMLQRIPIS